MSAPPLPANRRTWCEHPGGACLLRAVRWLDGAHLCYRHYRQALTAKKAEEMPR